MMANNGGSKLKVLYLRQILEEETDAEHGLTMPQIIERLGEYGVKAERKSIYRDLEELRTFGLDVVKLPRRPVQYAVRRHGFSMPELMLLADAVGSSRALTQQQAATLIANLKTLASDAEREKLDRRIHVVGRARSENDGVFQAIDEIHEAMRQRRKVSFMYFRTGPDGARHATRDGRPHVVTPVAVSYDEGFYYLTAWNDEHEGMTEFRIDRMGEVRVNDERATRNDEISAFAFDESAPAYFGRFGGEAAMVTLAMPHDKVEIATDRFGSAARLTVVDDATVHARVSVRISPQFFGWLAGLDGSVAIAAPARIAEEYRAYLKRQIEG